MGAKYPTRERLVELLDYDQSTGFLTWRKTRGRAKEGARAGGQMVNGYRQIVVDGTNYLEHRMVWVYINGDSPEGDLDHINGVRTDNRISNLRSTDRSGNMRNAHLPKRSTSGHIGVTWDEWSGKWIAQINADGKHINLGRFATLDEAAKARKEASARYGFSERHGEHHGR